MSSRKEFPENTSSLEKLANKVRIATLNMIHNAGSSHIGSAFSIAELLAVLYGKTLRVAPEDPNWPGRDRFIMSKGHACAALYAILSEMGFFPTDLLDTFYKDGSILIGHTTHNHIPGVEASTGSLGHGLSISCGIALAGKRSNANYRIFTLLSDGECNEGSTWEAVMFAGHHKLDNLVAIIDYNKIQSLGYTDDIQDLEPLCDKWKAFNWATIEVDGHDITQIDEALSMIPLESNKPTCIIAHTIKGKGVSFMENDILWHYRAPDPEEYLKALSELRDSQ